ncbi:hypothetical protein ACO2Q0_02835 [Phenylobacterium sp. VNQ135]|uniref:hypothetical protein n=1 Tax=Phenylobacterium sp. VNQ135 TaxID=3400922 RepID=UPI003C059624
MVAPRPQRFGSYEVQGSDVFWVTDGGCFLLSESDREALLDIFHRSGAKRAFLDLSSAHVAAGGIELFTQNKAA